MSLLADAGDPGDGGNLAQGEPLGAPAYVVLGMVRLGARSGYEIKQAVERSIRFFWTISQAQIYPSLARLERAGLVSGSDEPRGKRRRRLYAITADGEATLVNWLRREQPMPFELRDIGLVKLFLADALGHGDALALLAAIKRRSAERVCSLIEIEPDARLVAEHGNVHPLLALRMGIAVHQAMVDVCSEFEQEPMGERIPRARAKPLAGSAS